MAKMYMVNPENMLKFKKVRDFFDKYANEMQMEADIINSAIDPETMRPLAEGGAVECVYNVHDIKVTPEHADAEITVEVDMIDFAGDTLKEFIEVLDCLKTMDIENRNEGEALLIHMSVGDVWQVYDL